MNGNNFQLHGRLIEYLENDQRQTVSRSAKVTLLVLTMAISLTAAVDAAELETLVTTNGHRFEKARVAEVTPATITIVHAIGVCRVRLWEFPAEIQKRFGYDEAKARAWLTGEAAKPSPTLRARREKEQPDPHARQRAQAIAHYLDDGGHLEIDHATGRLYDPDVEATRRAAAWNYIQRYGAHRSARTLR